MSLTGGNAITQYLSPNGQVVINGTEANQHMFDNGYVMRWVSTDAKGDVRILTYGEGVNATWFGIPGGVMGVINSTFGVPLFQLLGAQNQQSVQSVLDHQNGR